MINHLNSIIQHDVSTGIPLLDRSVHCCVTSPPYWGLRDYGNDGQLGLEKTPEQYISNMVKVFMEVHRVLKDDGTLWLNLGDSYASGGNNRTGEGERQRDMSGGFSGKFMGTYNNHKNTGQRRTTGETPGCKPKDLVGIPWMLAFALRSAGWYLRQDIIWHKPNPMPESVTDRCTKAHEYIFLLSKSSKYYCDMESIKAKGSGQSAGNRNYKYAGLKGHETKQGITSVADVEWDDANKRSVWTVTTKPYSEAHFATFPEDLIVDCIKAGCPENGIVLDCFMGAGTTGLVARKLNRNYIGYELNEKYIAIAESRIRNEIGLFI